MPWVVYDEDKAKVAGAGEEDRVLYALTVGDLIGIYEEDEGNEGTGAWGDLDEESKAKLVRRAEKALESFASGGVYTWVDALRVAIDEEG